MILFPYCLNQTHWSFIEEIEESNVDMAVEIGKKAHVNTTDCQQENTDNGEINLTETAQHTLSPRLMKGGKDQGQNRRQQQHVTYNLHIEAQKIEKKTGKDCQITADNIHRNERNGKADAHEKQDNKDDGRMFD
ncbi:hypothetical protein JCM17724A_02630 [Prevotella fusca JCM 17724]